VELLLTHGLTPFMAVAITTLTSFKGTYS